MKGGKGKNTSSRKSSPGGKEPQKKTQKTEDTATAPTSAPSDAFVASTTAASSSFASAAENSTAAGAATTTTAPAPVAAPAPRKMLPALTVLALSATGLESLPDDFFLSVPLLNVLDISRNKLATLPSSLATLAKVTLLLANDNPFVAWPDALNGIKSLRSINLDQTKLESISEEFFMNKQTLTTLKVSNNQLATIPSTVSKCSALAEINLNNNALVSLPAELFLCTALEDLDVGGTQQWATAAKAPFADESHPVGRLVDICAGFLVQAKSSLTFSPVDPGAGAAAGGGGGGSSSGPSASATTALTAATAAAALKAPVEEPWFANLPGDLQEKILSNLRPAARRCTVCSRPVFGGTVHLRSRTICSHAQVFEYMVCNHSACYKAINTA